MRGGAAAALLCFAYHNELELVGVEHALQLRCLRLQEVQRLRRLLLQRLRRQRAQRRRQRGVGAAEREYGDGGHCYLGELT